MPNTNPIQNLFQRRLIAIFLFLIDDFLNFLQNNENFFSFLSPEFYQTKR